MDHPSAAKACDLSFLDLSGVDEQEQSRVLGCLQASPHEFDARLPWLLPKEPPKSAAITDEHIVGVVDREQQQQQQQQVNHHHRHHHHKYPRQQQQQLAPPPQHQLLLYQQPTNHMDYNNPYINHPPPHQSPPYQQHIYPSSPHHPHQYAIPPQAYVIYAPPHFQMSPPGYGYGGGPYELNYMVPQQENHYEPMRAQEFDSGYSTEVTAPVKVEEEAEPIVIAEEDNNKESEVIVEDEPAAAVVIVTNGGAESPDLHGNEQEEKGAATRSWASLFNSRKPPHNHLEYQNNNTSNKAVNEGESNNNNVSVNNKNSSDRCPIRHPKRDKFADPICYRMAEFLVKHNVDGRTISLKPRGLINRSNYCYINSILQALLACPPVYNLLAGLASVNTDNRDKSTTPIIDGMCHLVNEFQHLPAGSRVRRSQDKNHQKKDQTLSIDSEPPFEPAWIYKVLNGIRSDSFLIEGRQEDAEEFLGCLLNGLNDEMVELMKLIQGESAMEVPTVTDDKEWQVMGPKNKGSITRQMDVNKSPVSDIFGGLLKSRIHRAGDQSTYNIQPFFTLQLNIEKVKTVQEALEALVSRNQLEGVTSEKTNEEVEAWQQVTLEELPVILVLHLKCFDFKLDGCTKIIKALEFPIDLKIDSKWLSSKPANPKERQYKLFGVVYHDGKEASKGHYVTDAFNVGYSSWIRYDDVAVKPVMEDNVLKPQGTRVPYLLFYRRSDTIRSK